MRIIRAVLAGCVFLFLFLSMPAPAYSDPLRAYPSQVVFPNTEAGKTSVASQIVLMNAGTKGNVSIRSLTLVNQTNFEITENHCPSGTPLQPAKTCNLYISFKPQGGGQFATSINVTYVWTGSSGYTTSTLTVPLSGLGYLYPLEPSTTLVDFKTSPIDTTLTSTVTLTNHSALTITVTALSIPLGTPFSASQDCLVPIPSGGACDAVISFTPTSAQTYVSALTVSDDFENNIEIDLEGEGVLVTPDIVVSPEAIDFGAVTVNTSSARTPVTITSTGSGDLQIYSIVSSSSVYAITDDDHCASAKIAKDATCVFYVTFTPATAFDYHETVTIKNNAPAKTAKTVTLMGAGKQAGQPAVDLSLKKYDFGAFYVGEQSSDYPVTFVNVGESDLVVSNITASAGFGVDIESCAGTFSTSGSCTFQMYFAPSEVKDYNEGVITLVDNAPDPGEVTVCGVGMLHNSPALDVSEGRHDFGTVTVGAVSSPYSFTLSSVGDLPLTISGITSSGYFTVSGDCISTFSRGSSCTIFSTFAPTSDGALTGGITITDDAPDSPQDITLSGTGIESPDPVINIVPSTLDFGSQAVGSQSNTMSVLVKNVGGAEMTVSSVETSGEFSQENDCTGPIASQGKCAILVTYGPTTLGETAGTITITDTASGSPHTMNLRGNGTASVSSGGCSLIQGR